MIRIGLPPPMLLRLRLRAQIAANQMSRRARAAREGVLIFYRNRLATLYGLSRVFTRRPVAIAADPVALLPEFEIRYQSLVDLLCWAAKDGVHDDRDARYAELRAWFLENYAPMRSALLRHLETEPDDCAPVAPGAPAPRDAFESLFLPDSVEALIHSETIISRIMRTRCALDAYRAQVDSTSV